MAEPRIRYGGDYNPEQWPPSVWAEDAHLMQEAGVNLVSLGVFAWSWLEPQPGRYDFAWLDQVLDLLHAHGVQVALATATASPPPWLSHLYPESLPVTAEGIRLAPGSRQHYCPQSTAYRNAAAALVRRLAERYGRHPALALWHINNEYGCHVRECFCEQCAAAFRRWLQARYGSLDALNSAWGTAFWSQRYGDWAEILPPCRAPTAGNPSQLLDWRRFCSASLQECFALERAILRELTPGVPATTNFIGFHRPLDYWAWAETVDVVANDSYPDPADPEAHVGAALTHDLMRSLRAGQPWLLMEQAPDYVQWREHNLAKPPGLMRLWSYQALARGADGLMFFQWRASRAGAEQFHSAMLPHGGTETRTWREVRALGRELANLAELAGTRVRGEVAMLYDWESRWALELEGRPSRHLRALEQLRACYTPLYARNIAVDLLRPGAALDGYRLVILPSLFLMREELGPQLARFVAAGGVLLVTCFSGIVDANNQVWAGGSLGSLRALLGLRATEIAPIPLGEQRSIRTADGHAFSCAVWAEVLELEGASAIASYAAGDYAGQAAATRYAYGAGAAYYLGTMLDAGGMQWLLETVRIESGLTPPLTAPNGVEACWRHGPGASYLFLLNHTTGAVEVPLDSPAPDLLGDRVPRRSVRLAPRGVAILRYLPLDHQPAA
ncbi:MAG: beta-galactosidase [Chloroflexi bacterium OHK40]